MREVPPMTTNADKYQQYRDARQTLIDYLLLKASESDWHGVSDAANDLRVMEAAYAARSSQL
jgi:hypothetical protein